MATFYVSNSATNGFVLGNDANDGLTPSTSVLTLGQVATLCNADGASSNVIINDGLYTVSASPTFTKIITIDPYTPLGVEINPTAAAVQCLAFNPAGAGRIIDLGALVLNCNFAGNYALNLANNANTYNVNLRGTVLKNPLFHHVNDLRTTGDFTGTIGGVISEPPQNGATPRGISSTVKTAGAFAIDSVYFDIYGLKTVGTGGIVIKGATAGNTCTAYVKNATGNIRVDGATGGGTFMGIEIANIPNALIEDPSIILSGGNGSATGSLSWIHSTAAISSAGGIIRRDTGSNLLNGGYTCRIGEDGVTAGDAQANNGVIEDYDVTATSSSSIHGPMLGYNTGGDIRGGTMTGGAYGYVRKNNVGGRVYGNKFVDNESYSMYPKGATDGVCCNNDIICLTVQPDYIYFAGDGAIATDHTTGVIVSNNNVYSVFDQNLVSVAASNTSTFKNNNYYPINGINATAFSYQGTVYASLAEWQAAHETTATAINPEYLGENTFSDASGISDIGDRWWTSTGRRPEGFDGEPFSDYEISVGSTQSKKTPSHPLV